MSFHAIDWVAHHASATPNKLAMIELAGGRRFTYAQMNERVGRVAAMLKAKGIKKGDRVGFLTLNSSDTLYKPTAWAGTAITKQHWPP